MLLRQGAIFDWGFRPAACAGTQPIDGGGPTRSIPLSTNDLVFDSTRGVLYASMNPTSDGGNSVLTIEPASGTVTLALPVGGLPSVLAISDDCSALYVGISTPAAPPTPTPQIDRADSVRRIDLASMTAGPPVSLGKNHIAELSAGQIAAVPGSSTQYMVSRRQPGSIPDFAGLALYEGNTMLAELDSFFGSGDSIAFIDHSNLIGCSNHQPAQVSPCRCGHGWPPFALWPWPCPRLRRCESRIPHGAIAVHYAFDLALRQ